MRIEMSLLVNNVGDIGDKEHYEGDVKGRTGLVPCAMKNGERLATIPAVAWSGSGVALEEKGWCCCCHCSQCHRCRCTLSCL